MDHRPISKAHGIKEFGAAFWVDEKLGTRSLWLRQSDGAAIMHGAFREVLTWEQLKAWITDPAKKVLPGQRNLFEEEE